MAKRGILTVGEQRAQQARQKMAALGLEAHLRILAREILAGDMTNAPQLQQDLRYAPPEMTARLLDVMETGELIPKRE